MSYSPGNLPYDRNGTSDPVMGHEKSKVLSDLRIISFTPSSNTDATRYGLSDESMETIKDEFGLTPNPEVPIQLLPLLIDHVNDVESKITNIRDNREWTAMGAEIEAPQTNKDTRFGSFNALSGDGKVLAIGAPEEFTGGKGFVSIYEWNGSSWGLREKIDGGASGDRFSMTSLTQDGSVLVVGAYQKKFVYVYDWNGSSYVFRYSIDGTSVATGFGKTVSVTRNGDYLVVGSDDGGDVTVYELTSPPSATLRATISGYGGSIRNGISDDASIIALGNPRYDTGGTDRGIVRVYEWNGASYAQKGSDILGETADDFFGFSVRLSADGLTFVSGSRNDEQSGELNTNRRGSTRVFDWNGTAWVQRGSTIYGYLELDRYGAGTDISANGQIIASGGYIGDYVLIHKWNGLEWVEQAQLASQVGYGLDVSLSDDGSVMASGGYQKVVSGNVRVGSGQVYRLASDSLGLLRWDPTFGEIIMSDGKIEVSSLNDSSGVPRVVTSDTKLIATSIRDNREWTAMGAEIEAPQTTKDTRFGGHNALSGDGKVLAIGAPEEFTGGKGFVSIYEWNGSSWGLREKIDGGASGDRFSVTSLSQDGDVLVVGAYQKEFVYVYDWDGSSYVFRYSIDGTTVPPIGFGKNVDVTRDKNYVVVGSNNGENVTVYELGALSATLRATISGVGGGGVSISDDASIVAMGNPSYDIGGTDRGILRVYEWDGVSAYAQKGSAILGESTGDYFGSAVDLSADGLTFVSGSRFDEQNGESSTNNRGSTRVFDWNGSAWAQRGDTIFGDVAGDYYGTGVAISTNGQIIASGAYLGDYVLIHKWNGLEWVEQAQLASQDGYGLDVSLSDDGSVMASGAYQKVVSGNVRVGSGQVYRLASDSNNGILRLIESTGEIVLSDAGRKTLHDVVVEGATTSIKPTFDAGVDITGSLVTDDINTGSITLEGMTFTGIDKANMNISGHKILRIQHIGEGSSSSEKALNFRVDTENEKDNISIREWGLGTQRIHITPYVTYSQPTEALYVQEDARVTGTLTAGTITATGALTAAFNQGISLGTDGVQIYQVSTGPNVNLRQPGSSPMLRFKLITDGYDDSIVGKRFAFRVDDDDRIDQLDINTWGLGVQNRIQIGATNNYQEEESTYKLYVNGKTKTSSLTSETVQAPKIYNGNSAIYISQDGSPNMRYTSGGSHSFTCGVDGIDNDDNTIFQVNSWGAGVDKLAISSSDTKWTEQGIGKELYVGGDAEVTGSITVGGSITVDEDNGGSITTPALTLNGPTGGPLTIKGINDGIIEFDGHQALIQFLHGSDIATPSSPKRFEFKIDGKVTTIRPWGLGTQRIHINPSATDYGHYSQPTKELYVQGDAQVTGTVQADSININGIEVINSNGQLLASQLPTGLSLETDRFIFGYGGGSIALTQNDGKGNANLTFNHPGGVPDNSGTSQSACRIKANVDNSTGGLFFEVGDSTIEGQSVGLDVIHEMKTAFSRCHTNLGVKVQPTYELDVNGTVRANRFLIDSTSTGNPVYIIGEDASGNGHRYQMNSLSLTTDGHLTIAGDVNVGGSLTFDESLSVIEASQSYPYISNNWIRHTLNHHYTDDRNTTDLRFGYWVAMSGNGLVAAVGAPDEGSVTTIGLVSVYEYTNGAWVSIANIDYNYILEHNHTGSSIFHDRMIENPFPGFSRCVLSNDGSTLVVGAYGGTGQIGSSESVCVFRRDVVAYRLKHVIDTFNGTSDNDFGISLSLTGDARYLAIGASKLKKVFLYKFEDGVLPTQNPAETYPTWCDTIEGSAPSFGYSVALNDPGDGSPPTVLLVGAPDYSSNKGVVITYDIVDDSVQHRSGGDVTGETDDDYFGYHVDITADGTKFISGSRGHDTSHGTLPRNNVGAVRVFEWSGTSWEPKGNTILSETRVEGGSYGTGVAISNNGEIIAGGADVENYILVHKWNETISDWELDARLTDDEGLGFSISMSDDGHTIISGSYQYEENGYVNTGKAAIFYDRRQYFLDIAYDGKVQRNELRIPNIDEVLHSGAITRVSPVFDGDYVKVNRILIDKTTEDLTPTYIVGETNDTGYRYDWSRIDSFGTAVGDLFTIGNVDLPEMNVRSEFVRISKNCTDTTASEGINLHAKRVVLGSNAIEKDSILGEGYQDDTIYCFNNFRPVGTLSHYLRQEVLNDELIMHPSPPIDFTIGFNNFDEVRDRHRNVTYYILKFRTLVEVVTGSPLFTPGGNSGTTFICNFTLKLNNGDTEFQSEKGDSFTFYTMNPGTNHKIYKQLETEWKVDPGNVVSSLRPALTNITIESSLKTSGTTPITSVKFTDITMDYYGL